MPSTVRQQVKVFIDQNLSREARAKTLADIARAGVADLIASGKAPPQYRRFVDGRDGAPESSVDGDHGVILYDFSVIGEAAAAALLFLQNRSPERTGSYRKSFYVAVDGRFIPAEQFTSDSVPLTAEIIIGNTQPYSRKVDVQMIGNKPLSFSVPPGLFDDAARMLRRQYGNLLTAKRVYTINFPGQYRIKAPQTRRRGGGRDAGTLVESPALVINPLD